jgi:predicted component of type VI protein secretion system
VSEPRRALRAILGHEDEELARAFATYRAEFDKLVHAPGVPALSERGLKALGRMHDRTHALRAAIARVEPRIHEADELIEALERYDRGLLGLRVALAAALDRERAARADRAARRMQRGSATVERVWKELAS